MRLSAFLFGFSLLASQASAQAARSDAVGTSVGPVNGLVIAIIASAGVPMISKLILTRRDPSMNDLGTGILTARTRPGHLLVAAALLMFVQTGPAMAQSNVVRSPVCRRTTY